MTQPIERDPIYRGRRFQTETIELCVRWYLTYRLSCRDLAAMMAERGIVVSHTTIMRRVLRYVPGFERRLDRFARPVNSSWRMDETAIRVRGKSTYLYRAVDKHGKSVDSLLREDRGTEAAQAFFRKAVITQQSRWPRKVTLDGHTASHRALRLLCNEDSRWHSDRCWASSRLRPLPSRSAASSLRAAQERTGQCRALYAQELGGAVPVHGRRLSTARQQLRRTVFAARGVRPKELPLRRLRARRPRGRQLLFVSRELQSQSSEPAHLPDLRA